MERLDVVMVRNTLDNIPQFALPAPYAVRWYRPGNEAAWRRIQTAADKFNTFPPEKFAQQFGTDPATVAQRMCFLCDGRNREVGTMTAWFGEAAEWEGWGRVHWVAVVPELQGLGLSKPLMAATLTRLAELGHTRAYLTTATVRPTAINLYLKCGFLPHIRDAADLRAWQLVRSKLRPEYWQPALKQVAELE